MTEQELKYVLSLSQKHAHELGFIPFQRYSEASDRGRMFLQRLNDELCGFLLFGAVKDNHIKVTQTVIQVDARRIANATEMIDKLKALAIANGAHTISLRCADDLEANKFWHACGFTHTRSTSGGESKGRLINHYSIELPTAQQLLFPEMDSLQKPVMSPDQLFRLIEISQQQRAERHRRRRKYADLRTDLPAQSQLQLPWCNDPMPTPSLFHT
jgi:hypothetical protein